MAEVADTGVGALERGELAEQVPDGRPLAVAVDDPHGQRATRFVVVPGDDVTTAARAERGGEPDRSRSLAGAALGLDDDDGHRPGEPALDVLDGLAIGQLGRLGRWLDRAGGEPVDVSAPPPLCRDRKSTRLNSSHITISYAVFCLKKKKRRPYDCTVVKTQYRIKNSVI